MKVCFDDLPQESAGLLALDNDFGSNDSLLLDLYAFEDASINIRIKGAESQEIHIPKLQITIYNFNILYFVPNRYKVVVDQLEIKCPGIHIVADGLSIGQCQISTTRPQVWLENFQAEILQAKCRIDKDEEEVRKLLPGITVIPGCGEYVLNADHEAFNSLKKLKQDLPNVEWISPVVAWFASSLDLKTCQIKPGIDTNLLEDPKINSWKVGEYTSSCNFPMGITQVNERSIYGGTTNDASVIEYLEHAQNLGFKVIFYPLIMVNQTDKPWRGRIGRGDQVTAEDVQHFYENQYKPFILHYAELVAGRVDAFIIGSELIGLTSLKTEGNKFPFVKGLVKLAGEVKYLLENPKFGLRKEVKVSYAADWSEYHSVHGGLRPLDELWADKNIDFVGIDAYFPLTHSQNSRFSLEQLLQGFESGEGFDFYFEDDNKVDYDASKPYNQWKNLPYWWNSEHWQWDREKEQSIKTPWQPKMKPIWFTEFGFPSIDKAPNKPNVFYNPECSDGGVPTFSNGKIDYAVQRLAIRAFLEYWQKSEFIENMICWTWDARGENWMNCSGYVDGPLWKYGHWIDGKIGAPRNEIALKGNNIDIKQLVIQAPKVKFDQINVIIRDLAALSGDSLTISDSRISVGRLFASFKNNVKITPHIREEYNRYDFGKTVITTEISHVTNQIIEAEEALIVVDGNLIIDHATLKIKDLTIQASNIDCEVSVTENKRKAQYGSAKDPFDDWEEKIEIIQTAHTVQIISDTLKIDVGNLFKATAARIITSELHTEAKDYHFTGITLNHSVSVAGQKIRGILFFGSIKNYGSNTSNHDIEGVEVLVAGKAYVIADGKIWLQASQINADEVTMKAKQIELEALVGTNFHNMWVKKHSMRLALTCGKGELSAGIESKYTHTETTLVEQHLAPSAIIGRTSVDIETDELSQISSLIQGSKGTIKAKKWIAKALELIRSVESDTIEVSVGVKCGVQENITGTVKTIKHTISNLDQGGAFAGINTLSNIYSSARDIIGIAGGSIISPTPWISASANASHYEHADTTYAISEAMFDELYVESDDIEGALDIKGKSYISAKSMHLSKPEGETHEDMSSTSASVSNTGFAASHYQEEDGRGFGFGFKGSWDRKGGLFGDEFSLKYKKDKENFLDVSYAHPNREKLKEADFSLQTLPSRCMDNVNETLRSVFGTVGLEYKPITFDTIKETPKDEPVQDDISTLEQDLSAFDQGTDDTEESLSDAINDPFDLINIDEFLDIPEQDKPIDLDELQKALDLSQQVQDILNIKSSDEESKANPLQKQLSESQPAQDQKTDLQDAKGFSLKDVADMLIWAKKTYGDLAEKYPNATYIVEATVKGAPVVIAIYAGGVVAIPTMMAATAVKMSVEAVIGDQIDKIQKEFNNKLSKYLQDNEGLTPEQSAAIIGGTLLATEALRQGMGVANAAKYIKATKTFKSTSDKGKAQLFLKHEATHLDSIVAEEIKFMGKVGKEAETLLKKQYGSIHEYVKILITNDVVKLDSSKSSGEQINKLTKQFQKQFVAYQKNIITAENEHYITKIIGSGQSTKTYGHAAACDKLGTELAKSSEVKFVFLNQGVKKATGFDGFTSNRRPDITYITNDGKVHMIEVPSVSDKKDVLRDRMVEIRKQLPESMRGDAMIKEIKKILNGFKQ